MPGVVRRLRVDLSILGGIRMAIGDRFIDPETGHECLIVWTGGRDSPLLCEPAETVRETRRRPVQPLWKRQALGEMVWIRRPKGGG